ncbi:MAG: V-type ATPase subunit [Candidatus Micrarchaeota archaeon]|nr:V-type ATPase subunit [Candidatus Micrarchaeota archaeon]
MPIRLKNIGQRSALGASEPPISLKPFIYGYANARVRAMRPLLLSRRQAEDLLKVHTAAAVIEYLSRTTYKNDFAGLPPNITDEMRVELAVSKNFARTTQKLVKITPKQGMETLLAFLGKYDIHNVKAILLAKKLGKSREETQMLLVPAGSMGQKELNALQNAKGADEFYEVLRSTDFGGRFLASASVRGIPKEQIKQLFQNPGSDSAKLDFFLSALDRYYYETVSYILAAGDRDAMAIIRLLRAEADAKNIMTAMRLRKNGADRKAIMEHMVGGGKMGLSALEKMASAKDVADIASLASPFFFLSSTGREEFAAAEQRYKQDGQISHFEVVFERSLARKSLHALRRSMMSIGAIVGFLFLKEEEMANIQKIVRGKELGLPTERIMEMLVLVG